MGCQRDNAHQALSAIRDFAPSSIAQLGPHTKHAVSTELNAKQRVTSDIQVRKTAGTRTDAKPPKGLFQLPGRPLPRLIVTN